MGEARPEAGEKWVEVLAADYDEADVLVWHGFEVFEDDLGDLVAEVLVSSGVDQTVVRLEVGP